MKRTGIIAITFFMVLAILFGTAGLTIGKMTCLNSGKEIYSLGEAKDCCKNIPVSGTMLKSKCCELNSSTIKLDKFNHFALKQISPAVIHLFGNPFIVFKVNALSQRSVIAKAHGPPLLSGRELLTAHSVLLI